MAKYQLSTIFTCVVEADSMAQAMTMLLGMPLRGKHPKTFEEILAITSVARLGDETVREKMARVDTRIANERNARR